MKRLTVVFLVTRGACVAGASSAQAAPPTHQRVPVDQRLLDQSCGFLVQTHLTGFVLTIAWVDEDGTIRRFTAFPQGRATHSPFLSSAASATSVPSLRLTRRAPCYR